jgi:hypothetical protein
MATLQERKKRGEQILKGYRSAVGGDDYAAAADAIADILLCVAKTEREGGQVLQAAEMDFRCAAESEAFLTEG